MSMAQKSNIPSPAEIALMLKNKELGLPLKDGTLEEVAKQSQQNANSVRDLEIELKKRKRTGKDIQQTLMLLREKYDFSAMEELMMLASKKTSDGRYQLDVTMENDPSMRIGILKTLAEYEAPKLKSVEVQGTVDHNHTLMIIRYGEDGAVTQEAIKDPRPADIDIKVEVSDG